MRLSTVIAAAAAGMLGLVAIEPAAADGMPSAPAKAHARHGKVARYVRGTWPGGPDPYAYSYYRSGYYPYYDSAYWVPRSEMRYRSRYPMRLPEYYSSWGYPLTCKLAGHKKCGVPYDTASARRW